MGELASKESGRALARELGLSVADKPDSQEICFVSEAGGYKEFLRKSRPDIFAGGEIVGTDGVRLGEHQGVADFTVGQRRGIKLTARNGRPLYVIELKPAENKVVVGQVDELLTREVRVEGLFWSAPASGGPVRVKAKIRYNMDPLSATLYGEESRLVFDKPVRAVTPGQIAVAYRGATVLAGGTIRG
jgi:tRNA-specific 2-thiouridylase